MNYYLRYFDSETLVYSMEEAIEFLESIPEINVTQEMRQELIDYGNSNVLYPKRYKVRPRIYFIVIKTEAKNMQDFKDKKAVRKVDANNSPAMSQKQYEMQKLNDKCDGWYEGSLDFKRVVLNAQGKCEYKDTLFTARCIAKSPMHCYDRICEYIKQHVDKRSQFPSPRGRNYTYKYLGQAKAGN